MRRQFELPNYLFFSIRAFHYTYAVLHHPAYRASYEINLKREFPRLPFYGDFRQWAKWGGALMELHFDPGQAAPFALQRHDRKEAVCQQPDLLRDERVKPKRGLDLGDDKPALKPKLTADKAAGTIEVDAVTTLLCIPPEAWPTSSATAAPSNGCSTNGRNTKAATRRWRLSSTPTASPTTRSR